MSNKWLHFPYTDTGLDLIAKIGNWQKMSQSTVNFFFGVTVTEQGLWPTIGDQWGSKVVPAEDRTISDSYIGWSSSAGATAFLNAHSGAQGVLITHRGRNGTASDPALYYLWVGTYSNSHWSGVRMSMPPTTRWMGTQMTGIYGSTNPSEVRALNTIGLQMGASITSVSGLPVADAYTGGMTSTTTGTQPTGLSSLQHRGTGMGFVFGTNAQRDAFVANYPNGVGTWYVGLGDSLSFTKPGWTWDLSVAGTNNRAYISQSDHEVWHAPNTFAVGDDVQIIHTA